MRRVHMPCARATVGRGPGDLHQLAGQQSAGRKKEERKRGGGGE
ncbi:MAG: hypothetical protein ACK55Z_16945 [bacterium]